MISPSTGTRLVNYYREDAFVVVAEELCRRTSRKGGTPRSRGGEVNGGEARSMEDGRML